LAHEARSGNETWNGHRRDSKDRLNTSASKTQDQRPRRSGIGFGGRHPVCPAARSSTVTADHPLYTPQAHSPLTPRDRFMEPDLQERIRPEIVTERIGGREIVHQRMKNSRELEKPVESIESVTEYLLISVVETTVSIWVGINLVLEDDLTVYLGTGDSFPWSN
jgi:hypothetical protein